jgi:hypothetical protein
MHTPSFLERKLASTYFFSGAAGKYENKEKGVFKTERSFKTLSPKNRIPSNQKSPHNLGT